MDNFIVIDFVGLGGSGKTYLSTLLAKRLGSRCIQASTYKLQFIDILYFILMKPTYFYHVARFIISSNPKSAKVCFQSIIKIMNYSIKYSVLTKNKSNYIIFDEGMLHKLRQIQNTSKYNDITFSNINIKYKNLFFTYPDVVVFITPPVDLVLQRKIIRDGKIMNNGSQSSSLSNKLGEYERSIQRTECDIKAACEEFGFRYIRVYNHEYDSPEKEVEEIVRVLHSEYQKAHEINI